MSKEQLVFFEANNGAAFLRNTLAEWNCASPLLVTGRGSYETSGAKNFINQALPHVTSSRFFDFSPNPELCDLENGQRLYEEVKPDCVIAIGGGSALDMAKLIALFGGLNVDPRNHIGCDAQPLPQGELLPLVAIPTTAGTGSEATHFSVLYDGTVKHSVADVRSIPDAVVLNPEFLKAVSPYSAACTGMDALSQGIESYWAAGATGESKIHAEKAIRLAFRWLEKEVNSPNDESHSAMQHAAFWAGRAINISKTTAPHALSYTLTALYDLPHGHAVATTLPSILLSNAEQGDAGMTSLIALLDANDPKGAAEKLRSIIARIGLTNDWLTAKGLDPSAVAKQMIAGVNPERLSNNPRALDRETLENIVHASLRKRVPNE